MNPFGPPPQQAAVMSPIFGASDATQVNASPLIGRPDISGNPTPVSSTNPFATATAAPTNSAPVVPTTEPVGNTEMLSEKATVKKKSEWCLRCGKEFTLMQRAKYCGMCKNACCTSCLSKEMFRKGEKKKVRVCDNCFDSQVQLHSEHLKQAVGGV